MENKKPRVLVVGGGVSGGVSARLMILALAQSCAFQVEIAPDKTGTPNEIPVYPLHCHEDLIGWKLKGKLVDRHQQPWYRRKRNGKPARY